MGVLANGRPRRPRPGEAGTLSRPTLAAPQATPAPAAQRKGARSSPSFSAYRAPLLGTCSVYSHVCCVLPDAFQPQYDVLREITRVEGREKAAWQREIKALEVRHALCVLV